MCNALYENLLFAEELCILKYMLVVWKYVGLYEWGDSMGMQEGLKIHEIVQVNLSEYNQWCMQGTEDTHRA